MSLVSYPRSLPCPSSFCRAPFPHGAPSHLPFLLWTGRSWHNEFRGLVRVTRKASVHAQTGTLQLRRGQHVDFAFELLLTPTQPLAPRLSAHWRDERYAQVGYPSPTLAPAAGLARNRANVINYHQGLGVNPYINYPFVRRSLAHLRKLAAAAHAHGMRVKVRRMQRPCRAHRTLELPPICTHTTPQADGACGVLSCLRPTTPFASFPITRRSSGCSAPSVTRS
jgi:hypothetical protein